MKKNISIIVLLAGNLFAAMSARADYISDVRFRVMTYELGPLTIPAAVGEVTPWHEAYNSVPFDTKPSADTSSFFELVIYGTTTSDNVTWKTSNPGVGIQFRAAVSSPLFSPQESTDATNKYRLILNESDGNLRSSYYHITYRLVRLLDKVPSGKITSLPAITLNTYNPTAKGDDVKFMLSGTILDGIASQPQVTACTINAPTEIKLATLYGDKLVNGSQNESALQSIRLLNCPGAIDNITYTFNAKYGPHDAGNGVLNVAEGDGYAKNVYIQVQNSDGTAHTINNVINLAGYDGSGNYTIPDFKVAYFIDDVNSVTAGNVKSAIELQIQYN